MRLVLCLLAAAAAAGCSAQCSEPTYGGTATDEAWLSLQDALERATVDDARASRLVAPASGAPLSIGSSPPVFTWTSGLVARAPGKPAPAAAGRARWSVLDLLLPAAHAHGAPMSGAGTLVEFLVNGQTCVVRHLTSRTAWTPNDYDWSRLAGLQNKPVTVALTAAYFEGNRVTEGPYLPSAQLEMQLVP